MGGPIDDQNQLRCGIGAGGSLVFASEVAQQHVAGIPEFHLHEVGDPTCWRDANVGERPWCAEPVFAVDPDALRGKLVPQHVFETAQVAAKFFEEQSQFPEIRVGLGHGRSCAPTRLRGSATIPQNTLPSRVR